MSGDHNQYQESAPYDMKECGTCGYPLLPEERTGLVEVNGKMIQPPDVMRPEEPLCYLQETDTLGGAYEQVVWGEGFPVYTAPPQREWVSLTDEQIDHIWGITPPDYVDKFALPRMIEAKLKELNNE